MKKTETKKDSAVEKSASAVDPSKVKVGDIMAITHFVRVEQIKHSTDERYGDLRVANLGPGPTSFSVLGTELIKAMASADQFSSEEKATKTRVAEMLVQAFNQPFTVCFTTQEGAERVLRGKLVQPEPILGRSMCEDLEIDADAKGGRLRLVDHRTIKYLILAGVKYTVGK